MKSRFILLAIVFLPLAADPPSFAADVAQTNAKPNVLLIISDDLNDWIGPMGGNPQTQTPNLDRLAARGVTFENAQCAAPLCNPSRTAFLSGMRPSTTGIYENMEVWMPHIGRGLCLNDYIRKFGYTSYGAGKIYHYRNYRPEDWDQVVFYADDTLPNHPANRRPGPFGYRMFTEGEPDQPYNEKRAETNLVDARSVSWCVDRLAEIKTPFFMACGLHRPHTPWDVPKKYFDQFPLESIKTPTVLTNDLDDVPPKGREFANPDGVHKQIVKRGLWTDRVRAYLAAVAYMDAQVGRLLDALDKSPYATNTMIIFVGDNGWHLGQKEHWGKVTLWHEATCVPMIWVAPNVAKAGVKCEQAVDLMSIYPTVCELTGIPKPKHAEGVSIKRLLENPAADWTTPAVSTMYKNNHTAVTEDWRYIRYDDNTEELYNERTDPHEWTNIASKVEFTDVKKNLAKYFPTTNVDPVEDRKDAPAKKKKKNKQVEDAE